MKRKLQLTEKENDEDEERDFLWTILPFLSFSRFLHLLRWWLLLSLNRFPTFIFEAKFTGR